jgi:hypothetical protein
MAADEVHAPTNAGPGADRAPTFETPEAAAPGQVAVQERPEVQVGIAFAGGVLAALILKRLGR